jgi:phage tail sheath protein FI
MPQYTAPGVYVEEVASSVQPIAGVGTSTAGFVGAVANDVAMPPRPGQFTVVDGEDVPVPYTVAPLGQPQLVTSWEEFKNQFGDFQAGNRVLAHAVYGFFNNGGTRCWVARVRGDVAEANTTDGDATNNRTTTQQYTDALERFEAIDEIALVLAPGVHDENVQGAVVAHCERMGDRFAILDGEPAPATLVAADVRGGVTGSDYAAMYFPYIQVFDPVTNGPAFVPPSGHVAGIYARVDSERGVHKAPANETVRGATGVQVRVSRNQQGPLNVEGINVIRDVNGSFKVWGARTMTAGAKPEWTYINVRRLFLYLRESIDEGTGWVVFEPNTPQLWARISRNVTAFLMTVWRNGALFGNTPGEAFYVKCDASTNPPETRELGQVITEIGVSVARPAEFVIFRVSQWGGPGA